MNHREKAETLLEAAERQVAMTEQSLLLLAIGHAILALDDVPPDVPQVSALVDETRTFLTQVTATP